MHDAETFKRRHTISLLAMTSWLAEASSQGFIAETQKIIQDYCDQDIMPVPQTPSATFFLFPILPAINCHIDDQLPPERQRNDTIEMLKELSVQLHKAEQDPKRVS